MILTKCLRFRRRDRGQHTLFVPREMDQRVRHQSLRAVSVPVRVRLLTSVHGLAVYSHLVTSSHPPTHLLLGHDRHDPDDHGVRVHDHLFPDGPQHVPRRSQQQQVSPHTVIVTPVHVHVPHVFVGNRVGISVAPK